MRIDELHKFSDGTLNDVRNAIDDCLKGIRMQYLPQTIWRKGDKDRAAAMIQAIDKIIKTRRIMRSLERFIGGRLNFGPQLRFINTPSDSKWTPESILSIWNHLGKYCISVLGFWDNLLLSYHLKRRSWSFLVLDYLKHKFYEGSITKETSIMPFSSGKIFCIKWNKKNQKKSNEMYYPRFTKVIIHHFMTKKPSIPRRNRVNWHYVRDDILFSTIKV
nr:hypothetical protein [Tanacetum cinerariifolium]